MKIVKVFCVHELVMESKCNNMHGERIKVVKCIGWIVAKCCSVVMVLVIRCPTLLEDI